MAAHADLGAWKSRNRTLVYALVAGRTNDLILGMLFVSESDRLDRLGSPIGEIL